MRPARPRSLLLCTSLAVLALAGCASAGQPRWTDPPAAAAVPAAAQAVPNGGLTRAAAIVRSPVAHLSAGSGVAPAVAVAGAAPVRLDLTIVTGDMIGKTEYPALIPSDFVLPAYATVIVTVTNFDDATPLPTGLQAYADARGIVGNSFTVTPIDPKSPNSATGPARTSGGLDPAAVSHTITIAGLGINVPIAAHARETFTIHTGAPGRYTWHCMDPCGAGPTGWGTAMAAQRGYMEGTVTVA